MSLRMLRESALLALLMAAGGVAAAQPDAAEHSAADPWAPNALQPVALPSLLARADSFQALAEPPGPVPLSAALPPAPPAEANPPSAGGGAIPMPEPSPAALLLAGVGAVAWLRMRGR